MCPPLIIPAHQRELSKTSGSSLRKGIQRSVEKTAKKKTGLSDQAG